MAPETPFVLVKAKCPICDNISDHRYLKLRMIKPEVIEEDSHVVSYIWDNPEFSSIRPNFYHIWCCKFCYFCDESTTFQSNTSADGKLELIREKLLIYSRLPNGLITRLGGTINFTSDSYSIESALSAHLLAIYLQQLLSPSMRQHAKLARFYLRTAWLYREKSTLTFSHHEIPTGFSSYEDFLLTLQSEWSDIPLNEPQAISFALEKYLDTINYSSGKDIRFEINVLNIIISLLILQNRLIEALKYLKSIFSTATKARQEAKSNIQKGLNVSQNTSLLNFLSGIIESCTTRSETLNEKIYQEELPRAKEAVMQLGAASANVVLAKLRELNFSDITCRRVSALFIKQAKK